MAKKYDGMFIFDANVKDDALETILETVQGEITKVGGSIEATDVVGKRTFARPMHKRENGVYVKMRFMVDPDKIDALIARYKLSEDVFRVQFLVVDEKREAAVEAANAATEKKEDAPAED
jgi:ribosomal protein S6